jgi:hypothetical protein
MQSRFRLIKEDPSVKHLFVYDLLTIFGYLHSHLWEKMMDAEQHVGDVERLLLHYIEKYGLTDNARLDLSRIRAAPGARLSHFPFESDGAFPAQC